MKENYSMKIEQQWSLGKKLSKDENIQDYIPAIVPGAVQIDYAKANNWGDLNYGENVKMYDKLEDYYWLYKTIVSLPKTDEEVFFVSKGIDYEFDIFLNGKKIFYQEGMFTPVEINLTDKVKSGDVFEILIYPAPKRKGSIKNDRQEADQSCKPAVSYGWDWHPRLIPLGIVDDTYFEIRNRNRIGSCELFYTLSSDYATVDICFKTVDNTPVTYCILDMEGNEVIKTTDDNFSIKNPKLWWCNGQGEPYLYKWQAILTTHGEKTHGYAKVS